MSVISCRDLLLLARVWMQVFRSRGQDTVDVQPYSPDTDFELIQVRFVADKTLITRIQEIDLALQDILRLHTRD